jgi:glycosyltransferase involved in cell wall biosynthesis
MAREMTYLLESYYYRKPIFNMAPTNIVCSMINQRFKRPTKVFRRGIDIERFHPSKARKKNGKTVLYVSRLAVEKNVDMLRGFSEDVPNGRLVMVGDGPERKKLEREIPEAEFKGFLTGEPLAQEYASADLFIFPSITETYGNVVQEAMASGLPVVLDSRGASSELVRHGIDGFHYSSKEEMFNMINTLLKDDKMRSDMGDQARIAMEERTWERVFDTVYQGYGKALDIYRKQPHTIKEKFENLIENMKNPERAGT